jgi:light-regulated signal transduction histidine kinase (bacteriophytochrome)
MTKLTLQQLRDLSDLAIERVDTAFNSVLQLVEDDEQQLLLLTAVAASMCMGAAMHVHENLASDGRRPSRSTAYLMVLRMLSQCKDEVFQTERASQQ